MMSLVSKINDQAGRLWCKWTHPAPMWPVNGYYRCPECLRTYQVPWAQAEPARTQVTVQLQPARTASSPWNSVPAMVRSHQNRSGD